MMPSPDRQWPWALSHSVFGGSLCLSLATFPLHAQSPSPISRPAPLYANDSLWYQPIPETVDLDPNSAHMIAGLEASFASHGFVLDLNEWSVPVYRATPDTPRISVTLSADWAPATQILNVPIPEFARPDPLNDGHMVVIDPDGQCHVDFWQARRIGERWFASWANALPLNGNGIYPAGLGARAAGFGLLAGLIWPEELAAGRIDHALVFATGATRTGGPVSPATASDGVTAGPQAIPIGAHLQLDPSFDIETLPHPFLKTIAQALQRYGMYCADTTGGSVDLYAYNPIAAVNNPYQGLLPDPSAPFPTLAAIPASAFRVLRLPDAQPPASSAVVDNGCNPYEGEWMNGVRDVLIHQNHLYLADGIGGVRVFDASNPKQLKAIFDWETDEPATRLAATESILQVSTAGAGVQLMDITSPSTPQELVSIGADEGFSVVATQIAQNHLFLLADDPPLLQILDISQPTNPKLTSELEDIQRVDTPRDLQVVGQRLYITDQVNQIQVLDISDPSAPRPIADEIDQEIFPNSIHVSDNLAFVTDEDQGLLVLDTTTATPRLVASLDLPDFAFELAQANQHVFVANGGGGIQIIDVRAPSQPALIGSIQLQEGYTRSVTTQGSTLYAGSIGGGVVAFDISSPQQPTILSTIDNAGNFTLTLPGRPTPPTPDIERIELHPITFDNSAGFLLEISGPIGSHILLEVSDDLEEWEALDEITLDETPITLTDDEAVGEPISFYRARRP